MALRPASGPGVSPLALAAQHANVRARVDDGALHVDVRDDGVGGAPPTIAATLPLGV